MLSISCLLLHNGLFSASCQNLPTMLHPSLYHGLEFYFHHYWHKSHLTAGRKIYWFVLSTFFVSFGGGTWGLRTRHFQTGVSSLTECSDPWPCGQAHTLYHSDDKGFSRPSEAKDPPTSHMPQQWGDQHALHHERLDLNPDHPLDLETLCPVKSCSQPQMSMSIFNPFIKAVEAFIVHTRWACK